MGHSERTGMLSPSHSDYSDEERQQIIQNYHSCTLDADDDTPFGLWKLFCASWKFQVAVFLNYTLTLSLFPGVLSLMQWDNSGDEWFAVIQIFLFNLFDTVSFRFVFA